jgi:hypothetical protein
VRKTKKSVNNAIKRIVKKYGGKQASKLFRKLSGVGGNNFRRVMRRVHRVI